MNPTMLVLGISMFVAGLLGPVLAQVDLSNVLTQIPPCTVSISFASAHLLTMSPASLQPESTGSCTVPIDGPSKLSLHE